VRALGFLALAFLAAGCTRAFYRVAADKETYPIIAERIVTPAYDVGRLRLEPDAGSRLHDPFDPDRPPKPPDDAAAALWMHRPGYMKGARGWLRDGAADAVEPPGWQETLGLDDKGLLRLDADRSVEIALLNSREYQDALETVYLTALALTLNRYEFDLHWFLRNNTTYEHFGSGGLPIERNTLTTNTNFGFTRNLAAGGQLLVDFANTVVLEFTGPDKSTVRSTLTMSLVQPLLRNAGRAVRLEALTQAERDVLYAVRDFARFRKQFWADVAVQDGGYLDLLLILQTLRNNQANLKRQEETHRLYTELFRGGKASRVELDQFFQSVQTARLSIIDAEAALESALDRFKLRLGMPPRIPVELDDAPLKRFIVVDPAIDKLREELDEFQRARLKELDQPPTTKELLDHFTRLRGYAERVAQALVTVKQERARWRVQLDGPLPPGGDAEERERSNLVYESGAKLEPEIDTALTQIAAAIVKHGAGVTEAIRKAAWEALTDDIQKLLVQLDSVITLQTQARVYMIELPAVEYRDPAEALVIAQANRLDLQNRLAAVTDAWRQVRITANALKSDLNVFVEAELGTDPDHDKPFNFASEASRYAVGLRFDGPLDRQAERNAYRASLIVYQKARRAYMELADQIESQVRNDLRQLNRLRLGFDIARQQLLSAAGQFEFARLQLVRGGDKRGANDATTLNLLKALSDLLDARNRLSVSYINFEQQRIQLLLDLEVMQLDARGFPLHATDRTNTPDVRPTDPGNRGNEAQQGADAPGS
jgi:outer membrane protein TolC